MIQVEGMFAAGGEEIKRASGSGSYTIKNSVSGNFTVTSLNFRPKMFVISPIGAGCEEASGTVRGTVGAASGYGTATFYDNGFRLAWSSFAGLSSNGISGTANWYAIG